MALDEGAHTDAPSGVMAHDITVILDDQPGELARLGEVAGAAGVNLDGFAAFTGEGKGLVHVLVSDGSLGALQAALAAANVNIDLAYTTFGGVRLVFGTDDVLSARQALAT